MGEKETRTSFQKKWHLQLGVSGTNLEQRFDVPAQLANKVSQVQGLLGIQRTFRLSRRWGLSPEFFTLLPWRSGQDGSTKTFTSHFGLKLDFAVFQKLIFSFGPGLWWESYLSQMESVSLSNGGGQSEFYTPSSWRQVVLFSAVAGVELWVSQSLSLQVGVVAPTVWDPEKRRIHGMVKVGIRL